MDHKVRHSNKNPVAWERFWTGGVGERAENIKVLFCSKIAKRASNRNVLW